LKQSGITKNVHHCVCLCLDSNIHGFSTRSCGFDQFQVSGMKITHFKLRCFWRIQFYNDIELVGNLFIHVSEDVYVTWTFGHCLYQKWELKKKHWQTMQDYIVIFNLKTNIRYTVPKQNENVKTKLRKWGKQQGIQFDLDM
jgi:hypothetical protein